MLYPAGILKNTDTGRYHPIIFRPPPTPSGDYDSAIQRYKSKGHHTIGCDTIEEAHKSIRDNSSFIDSGALYEWDGKEIPAMTDWFNLGSLVSQKEGEKNDA